MKLSEQWIREWANPSLSQEELRTKLTMAGLEIESMHPVAEPFSNIVVGHVISVEKHPEADRLKLCQVDAGQPEILSIVCGASNVAPGMKVPAALIGAVLPNKMKITRSKIRGIVSHGMLCSAVELGLAEESNGLMPLPQDAPIGKDVWQYLQLSDAVLDISLTPNRGDCLSVLGMAKEISALTGCNITNPEMTEMPAKVTDKLSIIIDAAQACPHYAGRIIRNVKADAITPIWMQERLRRSGIRVISPVVDVMNYVMLELGQPMHAFDLKKIKGSIHVRMAKPHESIVTLDGQTIKPSTDTLMIADDENPLALAGVMGGLDSAVTLQTTDIFLESAYFTPASVAPTVRKYKLNSESSYRFERGIDPMLQVTAIERATKLLLDIVGGEPGPVIDVRNVNLPQPITIQLREARISKILGFTIPHDEIEKSLNRLGFTTKKTAEGWQVTVPTRRCDIAIEADLIEEVIRLYGYDRLPEATMTADMVMRPRSETNINLKVLRRTLMDLGYHEAVTYSFIDKKLQQLLDPAHQPKELLNPITVEMSAMRTNLWPGLINTLLYNLNRQQSRVRLFETGLRFIIKDNQLTQEAVLSGLVSGSAFEEQWGTPLRKVDFFDMKGDLQNIFKLTKNDHEFTFNKTTHPALHPGQAADIYRSDQLIGVMGALHPQVIQALDLTDSVFVFELALDVLEKALVPRYADISKFPEIRRDLAIFVDQTVPAQQIQDTIMEVGGDLLRDVNVFDVYQGKGVAPHQKSIALALTLQHASRTLVDEEVTDVVGRIVDVLKQKFSAELRG